jgi:hypothetical protein
MKVLLSVSAFAAALAAVPVAAKAAPSAARQFAPVVVLHGTGGERHAFWRGGDGDHDFWRRHHRHDFVGPVGPIVGQIAEPGPEPTPSPFVVAAPVYVNVTFAPGAGPAAMEPIPGPKIIEIGRGAPQRGHLPLIIYGD